MPIKYDIAVALLVLEKLILTKAMNENPPSEFLLVRSIREKHFFFFSKLLVIKNN